MLTNANIKTIIEENFNDPRIFAIYSFINRLIKRKKFGDGIKQYRIKNTNTGNYITNIQEFLASIDETKLKASYYYSSDKMTGDRVHPFIVSINNYTVELNKHSEEDSIYFSIFGDNFKRIAFLMTYIADGDVLLPIKIIEVKLI